MKTSTKKVLLALLAVALLLTGFGIWSSNDKVYGSNEITVHFKWEAGTPNIYYWNVNNSNNNPVDWPGVQMSAEGKDWYSYTISNATSANLIFDYSSWQTSDLSRTEGEWWFMDGKWYDYNPEAPSNDEIVVHLKTDWTSPKIYYWNLNGGNNNPVEWPGTAMKSEGDKWYGFTIAGAKSASIIFNNGSSNQQTKDLSRTAGEWWYVDGTWYDRNPEEPETPPVEETSSETTAPEGETPSFNGVKVHFKSTWGGAKIYYWSATPSLKTVDWPGTEMAKEGDNWYSYEFANTTKLNLIFNYNGQQTADLTRTTGEWWFKDNKWYDHNPEKPQQETTTKQEETTTPKQEETTTPKQEETTTRPKPVEPTTSHERPSSTVSRTDFRDETIYFLMTTRFYDGDESNNVHCWDDGQAKNPDSDPAWRGDFKGLIEKLDYIKALGFTAIWITPVVENASGYDYHGYHAMDFSKVDSRYESSDVTYQDLIDEVHKRDMKIIQDIVLNHTGNFGETNLLPMFEKSGDLGSVECMKIHPESNLPSNYDSLTPGLQYQARLALMKNTDGVNHDSKDIYHHYGNFNWDDYSSQLAQIAGDCVDLNTENPIVYEYLVDCYTNYINMGVDGFRIDTAKHISRLTFNEVFLDQFMEAGGENFFMFAEVCSRDRNVWYRDNPNLSTPFYTWDETKDYGWSDSNAAWNVALTEQHYEDNRSTHTQPTRDNAFLKGNEYHTPDYSMSSDLSVIDFPMHWNFEDARSAFRTAIGGDKYYNDATWNVTYVDSHDYAPDCAPENQRFARSQDTWAENLNLMFTFRGIPCIYYGSEIEFMKGAPIDVGPNAPLSTTGRAYFGDYIEGSVNVTGFAEYNNATGAIAETLNHPLSLHIQRLNKIRAAVPALRKGQYSTEGVSGEMAFKRRYTNAAEGVDSFVCVSVTDGATFTGIPNGKYVDAITGDVKNVTNGTLSIERTAKGNMRVYVLDTASTPAPGKVGVEGTYLK